MRQRCNNPNSTHYRNYGARGITVCERWADFWQFVADVGKKPARHSLDRIDNDGPYAPENCRWATFSKQCMNSRRKPGASGFVGVRWHKASQKWYGSVRVKGRVVTGGYGDLLSAVADRIRLQREYCA